MANSPSSIQKNVSLATFLATVVSDGDEADIVQVVKTDAAGQEAAATDISEHSGCLWGNRVDDAFLRTYGLYYKSTKFWIAADAAERDAFGSDDDLAENDLVFLVSTTQIFYCVSVDGLSSSTWSSIAATGNVAGSGATTDNAIARWNGAGGVTIQNSVVVVSDLGALSGITDITLSGTCDGRNVSADGTTLDAHVASIANPHSTLLAQTLAAGNDTDGTDLLVSNGDSIVGEDGGAISFTAVTGVISLTETLVTGDLGATALVAAGTGMLISEQAASPFTAAGVHTLWAKNTIPTTLWVTDDAGNDTQVATGTTVGLTSVLAVGNETGASDIICTSGQAIRGEPGVASAGGAVSVIAGDGNGALQAGGDATLNAGQGGSTGDGGSTNINGGAGGATSGAGGPVYILGGGALSGDSDGGSVAVSAGGPNGAGNPGDVTITASAAVSGNVVGGVVTITTGDGSGTQAGGALTGNAGAAGLTGVGGAIAWTAGAGGGTSGAGGAASLTGGAATNGNSLGGAAVLVGGAGRGNQPGGAGSVFGGAAGATGVGGGANLIAAAGGATSGTGGAAYAVGGSGTNGNATGGEAGCLAGAGQGSAAGGTARIQGGDGGATGAGGVARVRAGAGGATSGTGGAIDILAGAGSAATASGGMVAIAAGAGGSGAATGGTLAVASGAGGGTGGNSGNITLTTGAVAGVGVRGTITLDASNVIIAVPSYHSVRGSTARGSGNTLIYRWTSVVDNVGPDITYTDSGTDGGSWGLNVAGIYSVSCSIDVNHAGYIAIKRAAALSNTFDETAIVNAAEAVAGITTTLSWTGFCAAGDDIWIATSSATNPTGTPVNNNRVTVARVR